MNDEEEKLTAKTTAKSTLRRSKRLKEKKLKESRNQSKKSIVSDVVSRLSKMAGRTVFGLVWLYFRAQIAQGTQIREISPR